MYIFLRLASLGGGYKKDATIEYMCIVFVCSVLPAHWPIVSIVLALLSLPHL